jgi:hypothetical protein
MKAIASVRLTGTSTSPCFSVAIQFSSRVFLIFCDLLGRVLPGELDPLVAARRAIERHLVPPRRGVRRVHRHALHAQRALVDDVVEIAFERDQLAVADGGDHAAAARTEVARGRELLHVGELQCARRGVHRGKIDQLADAQPGEAAEREFQEVPAVDRRR